MDYQKLTEQLSKLYDNWGEESVHPKSNQFQQILEQVGGMTTTENVMQLLNFAVDCIEPDEIYCEVGYFQSATLIAALFNHPEQMIYAVDNFYESDTSEEKFQEIVEQLSNFGLEEQVVICNQHIEEFLIELRQIEIENKIGVYFYNGNCNYEAQLLELLLVRPLLADKALIILGNSNESAVRQASWDFIAAHTQCQILLNLPTPENQHHTFWNGIQILIWDITREYRPNVIELKANCKEELTQAFYKWQAEFDKKITPLKRLREEALALDDYSCYKEAEIKYEELLKTDENQPEILFNLGRIYYKTDRYHQALDLLIKCSKVEPSRAIHPYTIGLVLEKLSAFPQAIQAYQHAIALEPQWINAYNNLGNIFFKTGNLEQAESIYQKATIANPRHFGSYINLGNVLMERHQVNEAIETYKKALELKPRDPDILHNLGIALDANDEPAQAALYYGYANYRRGQYEAAIEQYQRFLETQTGDIHFYISLAECYKSINQHEEALKSYRQGIKHYPEAGALYFSLMLALQELGHTEEAIVVATEASESLPDSLTLKLEKQRLLPIVYETEAEINFYRHRFTQGLNELVQQTPLDTPEARKLALLSVGSYTNFYLQYQGKNDLELQKKYGQFVHQIMTANYPQWSKELSVLPFSPKRKVRIGYVSQFMRQHTVGKLTLGWLRHCNRNDFEIHCYYTGREIDILTQQFLLSCDNFYHIPEDLEATCEQIVANQLHVLVYLDIGMDPQMTQLASLRLAPVQCTTWGHPITSGIPTIDYFLSSNLMEPENAEKHYSEQLVHLPNIGFSYPKPVIPELTKTRLSFQLRHDAVIYLSCQSLFKYLPQYDYIFAAIAQEIPQAQFAFISHGSLHITEKLKQRLQRAFANYGLNSEEYCVILPRISWIEYLNLNLISDIFLDTLSWSGGNTTLEAIACNLPIVTCPSEFMRGRHSYGILQMLGVTETIAKNEVEYIEIAVKLGLDRKWRNSIVERMVARNSYLYDDKTCVEALEAFYHRVVQEGQSVATA